MLKNSGEESSKQDDGTVGVINLGGDGLPRIVTLWGKIGPEMSRHTIQYILELTAEDPTSPIEMWINSTGGDYVEATAIYDIMQYVPCPIHTIAIGEAMSAATLLLAAGEPGCRSIFPHTRLMIHQLSYSYSGTLTDMNNMQKEVNTMQGMMAKMMAKHTKMTAKQVQKVFEANLDEYLSPKQTVEKGFTDFIRGKEK